MYHLNATGPVPDRVKLTLEERRFVSTWVRQDRLQDEFVDLDKLTIQNLDEKLAELDLIRTVLWHLEGADFDSADAVSDLVIGDPKVIAFLRNEVAAYGYLIVEGDYFDRDAEKVAIANGLEDKFALDRRWIFDEPQRVAA